MQKMYLWDRIDCESSKHQDTNFGIGTQINKWKQKVGVYGLYIITYGMPGKAEIFLRKEVFQD